MPLKHSAPPLSEPSSHVVSPSTGTLSGATRTYVKRIEDLAGIYGDAPAFARACAAMPGRVVYRVDDVSPARTVGDLVFGTTFMEPGRIGDEFFVTRGHVHARADRPETYYGERGQGVLLLESPEGDLRVIDIAPRVMVYVPPYWIHRSVNVGATPLVMSFCYPADAGQNYEVIARSGGMAARIVSDGDGWKAVDNPSYRKRTPEEIAALYASPDPSGASELCGQAATGAVSS